MEMKDLHEGLHQYRMRFKDTGILNTGSHPLCIVRAVVDRGLFRYDTYDLVCPSDYYHLIQMQLEAGVNEHLVKTVKMSNPALGLPRFGILEIEEMTTAVPYIYEGDITGVYDADTVTVDFNQGFNGELTRQNLRLFEINAKEVRGDTRAEGIESRDYLRGLLEGKEVFIQTHKKGTKVDGVGKYGRWLASLYIEYGGKLINVNEHLVEAGLAQHRIY